MAKPKPAYRDEDAAERDKRKAVRKENSTPDELMERGATDYVHRVMTGRESTEERQIRENSDYRQATADMDRMSLQGREPRPPASSTDEGAARAVGDMFGDLSWMTRKPDYAEQGRDKVELPRMGMKPPPIQEDDPQGRWDPKTMGNKRGADPAPVEGEENYVERMRNWLKRTQKPDPWTPKGQ